MKKGIFERCKSSSAKETARNIEAELNRLRDEIMLVLTDDGEMTCFDSVALLFLLEPFVAGLRNDVGGNPNAMMLLALLRAKYDVTAVHIKKEGDHHV